MKKQLKTLHKAKDLVEALQIESILDSEGIYHLDKNQHVQNLFGVGQFGTGYNILTGQIEIKVFEKDFQRSEELLKNNMIDENAEIDEELFLIQKYNRYLNTAVILGIFFPGLNLIPLSKALKIKSNSTFKLGGIPRISISVFLGFIGLLFIYQVLFN